MGVKYNGYNTHCLTMENLDAVQGSLVTVDSQGRATRANVGNKIVGICVSVREGLAVIQTHGYISCNYTNKPDFGINSFVVGAGNTVNPAAIEAGGRSAIVLEVDENNRTVGFILC